MNTFLLTILYLKLLLFVWNDCIKLCFNLLYLCRIIDMFIKYLVSFVKSAQHLLACETYLDQYSSIKSCNYFIFRRFKHKSCDDKYEKNTKVNQVKSKLISQMNFKDAKDAQPFHKLPLTTLVKIFKSTKQDVKSNFCQNRLYYLTDKIKCSSSYLSPKVARCSFVYTLSRDWLKDSLDVLLEFNVPGKRIARDLWVLRYNSQYIRKSLQKVKDQGVENLYPWMVRCTDEILNRSISISQETKDVLGDTPSNRMYLAKRLNVPVEIIDDISDKIPAIRTIRPTKIKSFIDFLISEGFTAEEIAQRPRVLTSSQKTIEQRIQILRKLNIRDINLNILCRSRKAFQKYCLSIDAVYNKQST